MKKNICDWTIQVVIFYYLYLQFGAKAAIIDMI